MNHPPEYIRLLERRLLDQGVPLRHVRPGWVSLYRKLGLRPRPPVLFTFAEHLLWEGTTIALFVLSGGGISVALLGTDVEALAVPLGLVIAMPLYNWLRFRKVRAQFQERA